MLRRSLSFAIRLDEVPLGLPKAGVTANASRKVSCTGTVRSCTCTVNRSDADEQCGRDGKHCCAGHWFACRHAVELRRLAPTASDASSKRPKAINLTPRQWTLRGKYTKKLYVIPT